MPEVQNLHVIGRFVDAVINQYWRVDQLADTGATRHCWPKVWKALQELDAIQDRVAKPPSVSGMRGPGIGENFFKIRYRGFCNSNLEIH